MRLRKAQITAFGRFQNLHLDFAPGLNVIYGPNEAGKSTLLRFLQGMLFGLQKPGALRRQPLPELERLQPWSGAAPRGTLIYETQNGHTFRVERDFSDRGFTRLYDAATGQELTARFRQDRRKELLFAEEQLGLNDAAFTATACIGQMEAGKLGMTQELTTRLANLAGGGQEDLSITGVLKLLDQEMAKIGDPKRDSGKPLAEAGRRVGRLEAALEHGQAVRQENMENERRLTELRQRTAALGVQVAEWGQAVAARRYQEAAERLAKLRRLRQQLADRSAAVTALADVAGFPAEQRDEVVRLSQLAERLEREEQDATLALERILQDRHAAAARLEAFAPLLQLNPDAEAQVTGDFRQYSIARQDLAHRQDGLTRLQAELASLSGRIAAFGDLAEDGARLETRLDELEEQIHQAESEQNRLTQARTELATRQAEAERGLGQRRGVAVTAALVLAAAAGVLALVSHQPLLAGLAVLALPLWLVLKRPSRQALQLAAEAGAALARWQQQVAQAEAALKAAQAAKGDIISRAGCASVAEWKAKRRTSAELQQQRDVLEREAARMEEERRHIEQSLAITGAALAEVVATTQQVAAGLADARPGEPATANAAAADPALDPLALTDEHIRRFRQVWAAYRRAQEAVDEAARREVQARQQASRTGGELAAARRSLAERLQAAGAVDLAQYNEAFRRHQAYQKAIGEQHTATQILEQALAEGDEAQLEALLAELGPTVQALAADEAGAPEPAGLAGFAAMPGDAQEAARRWEAAKTELAHAQAEVRGLEERLEQAYRDLPDVAGLENELEEARAEKQALENRRWTLEAVKAEVEAASEEVHREFAPRLNQVASAAIASITGNRYREVRVDRLLGLRAVVPETGELRPVDVLSGGALDQFYLALRLGMADLLTAGGEPVPFLLDDTFVQFDDPRLDRAMAYLGEVAAANQVLLFTCHQREVAAARRSRPDAQVLELPVPAIANP